MSQLETLLSAPTFHAEGRPTEPVWICGLEPAPPPGVADDAQKYGIWFRDHFLVGPTASSYNWADSFKSSFGTKVGWVFRALQGHSPRTYKALEGTPAPVFKTNLWPISFPTTAPRHWKQLGLPDLIGIPNKLAFRLVCERTRHKMYTDLVRLHSPRAVLCFGTSYTMDYARCFAGNGAIRSLDEYDWDGILAYRVASSRHDVPIWVFPFAGRPLNSYAKVQAIGNGVAEVMGRHILADL